MESQRNIIYAILKYLEDQMTLLDDASMESVEVAKTCLEVVYGVSTTDEGLEESYTPLTELIKAPDALAAAPTLTDEQRAAAEACKNEGNELMKQEKFSEALEAYNKAIEINATNPVFYCNRAAARSKLNHHSESLTDCAKALAIDPNYSKAYGRKGLAHSALNQHAAARDCYKKAMELDPSNASYKQNLEIAQQRLEEMTVQQQQQQQQQAGAGGMPFPPGGGMDFGAMLNNPAVMNMAQQMFQDPNMQNMMQNMMQAMSGEGGGEQGLAGLMQAGQQLAQQMAAQNPEMVETLRSQMGNPPPRDSDDPNQPPPGTN